MLQHQERISLETRGRRPYDITGIVQAWLDRNAVQQGLLTLFVQHTSASLIVQENADPDVLGDLERFLSALAPDGDPRFAHDAEGPDDMPSHVRSALTSTHLSVPVRDGRLTLGTWQAIYLYEHRHRPHTRHVVLHYLGT